MQKEISLSFSDLNSAIIGIENIKNESFADVIRNSIFIYAMTVFERSLIKIVGASLSTEIYSSRYSNLQSILGKGKTIGVEHISSFCKNRFYDIAKILFNTNIDISILSMTKERDFLRDSTNNNNTINPDSNFIKILVDESDHTNEMFARRNALVHRDLKIDSRYLRDAKIVKKKDFINLYLERNFYNWNVNEKIGESFIIKPEQILNQSLSVSHPYIDYCLSKIKKILFILFNHSLSSEYLSESENFLNNIVKQAITNSDVSSKTQTIEDIIQVVDYLYLSKEGYKMSNPRLFGNILLIIQKYDINLIDKFISNTPSNIKECLYGKFIVNLFSNKKGTAIDFIPEMLEKNVICKEDFYMEPIFKNIHTSGKFLTIYQRIFSERFFFNNI